MRLGGASCWASGSIARSGDGIRARVGSRGPMRTVPKWVASSLPGQPAPRTYGSDSIASVSPSSNGPTARSARSPGVSSSSVAGVASGRRPPSLPMTWNSAPPIESRT